jgi:hypothetical protein
MRVPSFLLYPDIYVNTAAHDFSASAGVFTFPTWARRRYQITNYAEPPSICDLLPERPHPCRLPHPLPLRPVKQSYPLTCATVLLSLSRASRFPPWLCIVRALYETGETMCVVDCRIFYSKCRINITDTHHWCSIKCLIWVWMVFNVAVPGYVLHNSRYSSDAETGSGRVPSKRLRQMSMGVCIST